MTSRTTKKPLSLFLFKTKMPEKLLEIQRLAMLTVSFERKNKSTEPSQCYRFQRTINYYLEESISETNLDKLKKELVMLALAHDSLCSAFKELLNFCGITVLLLFVIAYCQIFVYINKFIEEGKVAGDMYSCFWNILFLTQCFVTVVVTTLIKHETTQNPSTSNSVAIVEIQDRQSHGALAITSIAQESSASTSTDLAESQKILIIAETHRQPSATLAEQHVIVTIAEVHNQQSSTLPRQRNMEAAAEIYIANEQLHALSDPMDKIEEFH
ncbi:unnamed protein product [Acanthoscelides obtectus]|uniref:Uncharacterized protein n=1 Tax=Acanthoscelides obtectus TaxID=200917 RepID=A0A9P0JZ29_ACAOB|nr:unnamed protein product [Acanthoscelides obtectus]CAK1640673.1 hypothetical protein AOBTE_LOCUS11864 [Acanthoscelides obtectus]